MVVLINIIRILIVLYDVILGKKCSCIDEIEYGIHTKALSFILKMYLTLAEDCQVIVATHDLSLLNTDFLRRDAVRLFENYELFVLQTTNISYDMSLPPHPDYVHPKEDWK